MGTRLAHRVQTSEHGLAEYSYRVKYMFQLLAKAAFSIPWGNFISSKKNQTHYSANISGKSSVQKFGLNCWERSWNTFWWQQMLESATLSCILKFIDYSKSEEKKILYINPTFLGINLRSWSPRPQNAIDEFHNTKIFKEYPSKRCYTIL